MSLRFLPPTIATGLGSEDVKHLSMQVKCYYVSLNSLQNLTKLGCLLHCLFFFVVVVLDLVTQRLCAVVIIEMCVNGQLAQGV